MSTPFDMEENYSESSPLAELSPTAPRDYFRLLWWLFVTPEKLRAYRETFGEQAALPVGSRLTVTLALLPLLIPALALGLGLAPRVATAWPPVAYLGIAGVLAALWALYMARLDHLNRRMVARLQYNPHLVNTTSIDIIRQESAWTALALGATLTFFIYGLARGVILFELPRSVEGDVGLLHAAWSGVVAVGRWGLLFYATLGMAVAGVANGVGESLAKLWAGTIVMKDRDSRPVEKPTFFGPAVNVIAGEVVGLLFAWMLAFIIMLWPYSGGARAEWLVTLIFVLLVFAPTVWIYWALRSAFNAGKPAAWGLVLLTMAYLYIIFYSLSGLL